MMTRLLQRAVDVKDEEIHTLLWAVLYFFCVLSAYYIIRPIRDEMGVAGGVRNLPWLFTATLVAMISVNPLFASLVARLPRKRFIPLTYRFFGGNLLFFFLLLKVVPEGQVVWVGRVFFVWVSVFNLFVVSIFWAFMADVFRTGQSKRLFGFIGAGGTLGGLVGAGLTASLAGALGPEQLLLLSVLLLEVAVWSTRRLAGAPRQEGLAETAGEMDRPIGGSVLAAIPHILRSPYLLGICGYMLLYAVASTFLYFQQAEIADQNFPDRDARTAFFAWIDVAVNTLTLLTQFFATGRLIRLLGVAVTLALLPALCVIGFTSLGLFPTMGLLVIFQVLRRAGNYAVARPTRETLFTVISREDKYKAKSLIDTFVYRAGDQIGAWSYGLMGWLGLSMGAIAFAAVPISALWLMIGYWLGQQQRLRGLSGEPPGTGSGAAP